MHTPPADAPPTLKPTPSLLCLESRSSLFLLTTALLIGCGSPGTPQPPSLKLPTPPTDLTASRSGDAVTLHWTMPRRATDRVPLLGDQRVVICRAVGSTPCLPAGQLLLQPGLPATYMDTLPVALLTGLPRLLTYTLLLENHKQRSAGPSNPAYTAAGPAPPTIEMLRAEASPSGILLHWQPLPASAAAAAPANATYLLRLHRTRLVAPGERPSPVSETRAGVPQPIEQTLELAATPPNSGVAATGWLLDHATDRDAALNRTYRYTVERVAHLTLDAHAVEVTSAPGTPVTIIARDLFPPATPQGLEAVADTDGGAIDLSWTPNSDPDLSGYRVYRRPAAATTPPQQVSGAELLPNPAWRDASAQPGLRYAYSVSAVDTSGNESSRTPEVQEVLDKLDKIDNPPAKPDSQQPKPHR